MDYYFSFIASFSNEERTLFDNYFQDLQSLKSNSLIIPTAQILSKIRAMLYHPSHWREFIARGLNHYVNHGQANCFINLDKLYDNFDNNFSDELNKLSVQSLIELSHPVMSLDRQLNLLSTVKSINAKSKDILDSDPEEITLKEFENIISIYLKVIMFNRGLLYEEEFGDIDIDS